MAMPVTPRIQRRGSPELHLAFGQHWTELLETRGSCYLGDNARRQTARVTPGRPDRILAIDVARNATVYANHCLHAGKRLLSPSMGLRFHESDVIRCSWHHSTYRTACGTLERPGAMEIPIEVLPEKACRRSKVVVWQNRLVFELGSDVIAAQPSLELALDFIQRETGEAFDFHDYVLRRTVVSPQMADLLTTLVNYLDIRHLGGHGDTLGQLVDLSDYTHAANPYAVVQRMGLNPEWLDGDSEWVKKYYKSGLPRKLRYGAVWAMTCDGLMLEWYPGVIVVSQGRPRPDDPWCSTLYHDFYYHKQASEEFILAHQPVFEKTGREDELWCGEASEHLAEMIANGVGSEEWGFLDPVQENYARWLYDIAAERFMPEND